MAKRNFGDEFVFQTRAVHTGNDVDSETGAIKRPITMANSYELPYDPSDLNWSSAGKNLYTRNGGSNQQYLQAFLSKSLVEASRIDGCGEFRTFNTIVIPIIKPAIAVQGIFAFVSSWNNYFLPALVINSKSRKTIPILIAQLRAADYMKFDLAQVYMLIFIAIIPLLIVYLLLSRQIIGGVTLGGVKE